VCCDCFVAPLNLPPAAVFVISAPFSFYNSPLLSSFYMHTARYKDIHLQFQRALQHFLVRKAKNGEK